MEARCIHYTSQLSGHYSTRYSIYSMESEGPRAGFFFRGLTWRTVGASPAQDLCRRMPTLYTSLYNAKREPRLRGD